MLNGRTTLAVLALAWVVGCGSGPDEKEGGLDGAGKARPPGELWQDAQVKEATGDKVQSFARIQYYQEAMLEYQSLADRFPRSRKASGARAKVKSIRGRVDALCEWKKRWDAFDAVSRKKRGRPDYVDEARREAGLFEDAPFSFVRETARMRFTLLEKEGRDVVEEAWKTLQGKVDGFVSKRDWRPAWKVFGSFDPDFGKVFPEYATKLEALREEVAGKTMDEAREVIARAREKASSTHPFEGVRALVRSRGRFQGTPVEAKLKAAERELRARARRKILEERKIASKVAPPEPEPAPEPAKPAPGSHEEKVDRAMKYPRVPEKVPSPAKAFDGASDPLAVADGWYYKAVRAEKKAMPGLEDYVENLKDAIRLYEGVRKLYTQLLEENKGPSEEIEERLVKVNGALFWCKKNLPLAD